MLKKKIRQFGRYRDIVYACTRHGFGFIMKEMGLIDLLSVPRRIFVEGNKTIEHKTTGERIRLFLEELGPTFVKMGQIASTRPDIIPKDIIQELVKLQDQVPPFAFTEVRKIIEEELGETLETAFSMFNETPVAAASIGQVHTAKLLTGEKVAVKILRPTVKNLIETDLEILQDLSRLAEARLEWARRYQIREIIDELAKSIRLEIDFENEARNSERIAKGSKSNPNVLIPKIYWEYTTSKILTMEYLDGIKLNDEEGLRQAGYDFKHLAETVVTAIFQQILIAGFFHGDPHPGNILALPGGKIAFIDFGIIGRLTPEIKMHVATFVIALMNKNTGEVVKGIKSMGLVPDTVNHDKLYADVDLLREKYSDVPFSEMRMGEAVNELFTVAFRHQIQIPVDLTILGKTLLTMEGVVERLDPGLSIMKVAEPFGRQLIKERFHPKNIAEKVKNQFNGYEELLEEMPKTLRDITAILKKGRMKIDLTSPELDIFIKRLNKISNRISFSIILLSFCILMVGVIIGTSLSGQTSVLLSKIPAVEIGFSIATAMFLWLLFSIFKSGRF